ncbi:hypothetical protein L202_07359 [Cryptococcus amylolentus CBS 6039]|uniref:Transcriptional regulatory protein RXT2 N-terminal domain-containing protein n=2 Tax=Cryptococcus amylolentus TaxID=104669 RepID=A0A1E3HCI5_9TREE|nr:hypothetical protein L202_07359 [Cryptococcus amylolentus CBS 6039]ODN73835.1 hypothetical protein L202_07359 [Cryptococcus amylolentus CBS 6039]ODO00304.1 hypothetical protein I350_06936 [Cryptococcus amylolentus CBS 6273]
MPPQPVHHGGPKYGASIGHPGGPRGGKQPTKLEIDSLPSMDKPSYYDPPSSPDASSSRSASPPPPDISTNSGNKLVSGAQFARRGKMYAWGPSFEAAKTDQHARKRLKLCLEQFMPGAAAECNAEVPANIVSAEEERGHRKRKRNEEREFILPHLRSPSPPISTARLTSLLALPQNYTDVLLNPAMRHSLGEDGMEQGLQRTAGELLEGEKPLLQALGRLRDVIRVLNRDVPEAAPSTQNGVTEEVNGHDTLSQSYPHHIPPLPNISETDNLWRVTQELLSQSGSAQTLPPPTLAYTSTQPGAAAPTPNPTSEPEPEVTPLQRLFTCPTGITLHAVPNPGHPGYNYPQGHTLHPQTIKYNIDMRNQCRAVDDAWERISELLADCNEYRERLEEARDRVADVARVKKKVWRTVKERAAAEMENGK